MSAASPHTRKILFALLPALLLILLVGSGMLLGRYLALRQACRMVEEYSKRQFLGDMVNKVERREVALAYKDPAAALENLDNYSWSPLSIPAPFVGSAPMPDRDRRVMINSMGFRCDHELATPKPKGLRRIFITGGSTAYGSGAPDVQRTIGGYLEALLRQEYPPSGTGTLEVIVAAGPAWTSAHERILIENRISRLEPDLVVSLSGANDIHWGLRGRDGMWFRTYAEDHFLGLVRKLYDMAALPLPGDVVEAADSFVAPTSVAQSVRKNAVLSSYVLSRENVPYYFVLQPTILASGKRLTAREAVHRAKVEKRFANMEKTYFPECYKHIRESLAAPAEPNLRFVDLSGVFDGHGENDEIFLDSYHFGDRGNEIIAKALLEGIRPFIRGN